jgi:peptidyl-dipeptidase Dcp
MVLQGLSCSEPAPQPDANPFFADFDTPFGVPPFDRIEEDHYMPAFQEAMERHRKEIGAITASSEMPTFENTIEALEQSGALLTTVSSIFYNLNSAITNEKMQVIAKEVAPVLSQHEDDILLDPRLFERVRGVYEKKDGLDLTTEQHRLLEKTYKNFVRGGANLDEEEKNELREINKELSILSVQYGENVLKETNKFEMLLEREEDLAGLPEAVRTSAAEAAAERGHEGKWLFTLHKPSMIPFLQYAENRSLREKIFSAYISRGNHDDELDNKLNAAKMAALRAERARLLGYETHADYVLEESMATEPEKVYELLHELWQPALAMAQKESDALQAMVDEEGGDFDLEPWDWWFYAEKLRKAKFDLDDEALRPYFKLENVMEGAFWLAGKLYGLTFEEQGDLPKYHPDVKTFEVKESDGSHVGILYLDYFPRASKEGGAWMDAFRKQARIAGKDVTPVLYNVGNFSKPTGDKPSLLSFEEVATLFHEFGHALHGLLSDCTYASLSGTSVPRDFVELPSQIMENWISQPEVLEVYAKHYETGEVIPEELVEKIRAAGKFNQGFATVEYLAASFLDMDWHTMKGSMEVDALDFEKQAMDRIGLIPEIVVRYRSPYFTHIFAGGYSSGYYSYVWAEVLDADAFQAFKEKSLFDRATAKKFRENILARGNTEDPMALYVKFRGAEPKIDAVLERKGLR